MSLTIFNNTIFCERSEHVFLIRGVFFVVFFMGMKVLFVSLIENVCFVCCGKIFKNKFLNKYFPNNPENLEENYVLFGEIRF